MYEFLLEEMAPREMLAGLIARTMKQDTGGFSWRHCFVADDKGVVGMINAFPAAWLREEERDILPQDRVQILDPIDQAQDWESFLVNSVAVRPATPAAGHRHAAHGVGHRAGQGRRFCPPHRECVGRQRCRLVRFSRRQGFAVQTQVEVAAASGLAHVGGSLLMVRQIDAA